MMAAKKRFREYYVAFEPIFDPEVEIQDIRSIELWIRAQNIDDAQQKAWQTVSVSPTAFEITEISSTKQLGYKFKDRL